MITATLVAAAAVIIGLWLDATINTISRRPCPLCLDTMRDDCIVCSTPTRHGHRRSPATHMPRQRHAPEPDGWVMVCDACGVRTTTPGTVEAAEWLSRQHDIDKHDGSWMASSMHTSGQPS